MNRFLVVEDFESVRSPLLSRHVQRPRPRLTCDSRFGDLRDEEPGEQVAYGQYEFSEAPTQRGDAGVQWVQGYAW